MKSIKIRSPELTNHWHIFINRIQFNSFQGPHVLLINECKWGIICISKHTLHISYYVYIFSSLSRRLKWAFLIKICRCPSSSLLSSSLSLTFHIFVFFTKTTRPISTKLGTKYLWVNGIQLYSNEGPHPFSRGDNYKIAKIHWRN